LWPFADVDAAHIVQMKNEITEETKAMLGHAATIQNDPNRLPFIDAPDISTNSGVIGSTSGIGGSHGLGSR
jgi:hypothetical protein